MSTPTKQVAFHTLGCKLNFSETSVISKEFIKYGFEQVKYKEKADIYVINTCSVTENANKEARKFIRKAKRTNPNSVIAIIGCYAQLKPKEISKIKGVDIILGAEEKFNLLKHLDKLSISPKATILNSKIENINEFIPSFSYGERTRSYLKVQDGCNYNCTFCTIPLARGISRSNSIKETLKVANKLAESEVREIVLTGVNIGDFGQGKDETFFQLITEMDKIKNIDRIRISSIEPNLLNEKIIKFCLKSKKFMPHFHIPLQSGSNKILSMMKRRYNLDLYSRRIRTIKSIIPDCCIGVDVLVGFPGESDDDFLDTYHYLNELNVSYFHVFTYSERENTEAYEYKHTVPSKIRYERSKMLRILSEKKRRHFYNEQLGQKRPVLFESIKEGYVIGHTDNYVKVKLKDKSKIINSIKHVNLLEIENAEVFAEIA
ncbi:MAG: tRNA (N(6)-L-threonylcarbamoyladenosine(37)-C(2))-methylthiotransferase MtaB [Candidatus Neomarinimicrobiota bacterium]